MAFAMSTPLPSTPERSMSEGTRALQVIVATLRDGSEHTLLLDTVNSDAAHILDEVSAGRSQLLRGWVAVVPPDGATQAVVSGDEIVQLRLVEAPPPS
jgi:hypothetical protein